MSLNCFFIFSTAIVVACCFLKITSSIVFDDITSLTVNDLQTTVTENKYVLVEFYSNNAQSEKFKTEYAAIADAVSKERPDIKVTKVDTVAEAALAEKYQVKKQPKFQLFRDGAPIEYTGDLDRKTLYSWVKRKSGPTVRRLHTQETATKYFDTKNLIVIAYIRFNETEKIEEYEKAAAKFGHIDFALISKKDLMMHFGIQQDSIYMHKDFDAPRVKYPGKFEAKEIGEWLRKYSVPLMTDFKPGVNLFAGQVKRVCLLFVSRKSDTHDVVLEEFGRTAEIFRGSVSFVYVNVDDADGASAMNFYGVKKTPDLRYVTTEHAIGKRVKYAPKLDDYEYKQVNMVKFIEDAMHEKLKPFYKSEEIPPHWDLYHVKPIVRDNFKAVVLDKTKDVFVLFYSPKCVECKGLDSILQQVAVHYKDVPNVLIGQMDATANEIKQLKITAYPTMKLYTSGTNKVVVYEGEHTVKGITDFIEHIQHLQKQETVATDGKVENEDKNRKTRTEL